MHSSSFVARMRKVPHQGPCGQPGGDPGGRVGSDASASFAGLRTVHPPRQGRTPPKLANDDRGIAVLAARNPPGATVVAQAVGARHPSYVRPTSQSLVAWTERSDVHVGCNSELACLASAKNHQSAAET